MPLQPKEGTVELAITKEEFIELYKNNTKAKLCKILGLSRYYIDCYEAECGLKNSKKAGRPPTFHKFKEEEK